MTILEFGKVENFTTVVGNMQSMKGYHFGMLPLEINNAGLGIGVPVSFRPVECDRHGKKDRTKIMFFPSNWPPRLEHFLQVVREEFGSFEPLKCEVLRNGDVHVFRIEAANSCAA